jgi:MMPL family
MAGACGARLNQAIDGPEGRGLPGADPAAVHAVPGANALVGGTTAINLDVQRANAHDRDVIIPLILVVVFVILALLLRALVARHDRRAVRARHRAEPGPGPVDVVAEQAGAKARSGRP